MNQNILSLPTMICTVVLLGLLNESTRGLSVVIIFSALVSSALIIVATFLSKRSVIAVAISCSAWMFWSLWEFFLALLP